jgi:hypothetical protein
MTSPDLTDLDRQMLSVERQWWQRAGSKDAAIRDTFGMTGTRYHQLPSAPRGPRHGRPRSMRVHLGAVVRALADRPPVRRRRPATAAGRGRATSRCQPRSW